MPNNWEEFLLLAVLAHLVENIGDKALEPLLYLLSDGTFRNVGIFLYKTVAYLKSLIVKGSRSFSPRIARSG